MKTSTKWLTAAVTLVLVLGLSVGAAYALFSSQTTLEASVSGGQVDVRATIQPPTLYSPTAITADGTVADATNAATSDRFFNGGTATTDGRLVIVDNMTPGDRATFVIKLENHSTVAIKYQTTVEAVNTASSTLYQDLIITVDGRRADTTTFSDWVLVAPGEALPRDEMVVSIELPPDATDRYMGESAALAITVEAVQGNAVVRDGLELSSDGTWEIYGSRGLGEFRDSVAAGATYTGETVRLLVDIDLRGRDWTPIGAPDAPFSGTFDGDRHTISHMSVGASTSGLDDTPASASYKTVGTSTPAQSGGLSAVSGDAGKDAVGFFGFVSGEVAIHDLIIRDATVTGGTGVAPLVGQAGRGSTLTLSRITLAGTVTVTADRLAGGLVGDAADATVTANTLAVMTDAASMVKTVNAATTITGTGTRLADCAGGVFGAVGGGTFTDIRSNIPVSGRSHGVGGVVGRATGVWTRVSASGAVTVSECCDAVWYKNTLATGNAYGDIAYRQGNGTVIGLHAAIELENVTSTGTLSVLRSTGAPLTTNGMAFKTADGGLVDDSRMGCSYRFNDNTVVIRENA